MARRRMILPGIGLGLIFVLLSGLILTVRFPVADNIEHLQVGDVAPRDILAPRRITYVSEVETEAARARAEAAVAEIYDLPDASIARRQIARARQILDYFDSVRADAYASLEEKRELVAAVNDLVLTDNIINGVLSADNNTWLMIKGEVISVLDQAMRTEIRPAQLATVRRRLPTLISLDVSDEAAQIIVAIVEDLIQPNTFINQERTAEERRLARESVQPISVTFEQNEVIVRAGEVIRPEHLEAFRALGLREADSPTRTLVGTWAYLSMLYLIVSVYVWRFRPPRLTDGRYIALTFGLSLLFMMLLRVMIPGRTLLPYFFPVAAWPIVLGALVDVQFGMLVATLASMTVGYITNGALELMVYCLVAGWVGTLSLGRFERVSRLLWAGIYVTLCNMLVILIFRVPARMIDPLGLLQLMGAAFANGTLSASLPLLIFFVAGSVFRITTSLQLLDLARPTQPLLRQLLLKAPGTYHHSLLVSNLAEQAAERIGADTLLTRVGAYYHDIGKVVRPYFFVENQMYSGSVQERLDPYTNAQVILSHVHDGLELARKYRLPPEIQAFIAEHQGTSLTRYFYNQALEAAEDPTQVDAEAFRYPGPRPQSKETAIVMLADASESAVRASNPGSVEEIDQIVGKVILERLVNGELDECDLTMRELNEIRETFVQMLQGAFHPRIKYPEVALRVKYSSVPRTEIPSSAEFEDLSESLPLKNDPQEEIAC
ncbi:MAG: HDIG domain-containing protein [Anaerolineae bacterium]|nr:HDIG domain-containing protein [Anaerolineae bacterium]MDW8072149.1 HDIG domain-containing protein [Anaerolineae bacterium]